MDLGGVHLQGQLWASHFDRRRLLFGHRPSKATFPAPQELSHPFTGKPIRGTFQRRLKHGKELRSVGEGSPTLSPQRPFCGATP